MCQLLQGQSDSRCANCYTGKGIVNVPTATRAKLKAVIQELTATVEKKNGKEKMLHKESGGDGRSLCYTGNPIVGDATTTRKNNILGMHVLATRPEE